jgi:hypothetical protein
MSEIEPQKSSINPAAFWKTGDILHRALDRVYDAADEEIEDVLKKIVILAGNDRSLSISSWSLRISNWGLEIVTAPIEQWVGERELSTLCYMHDFPEGSTLGWLLSLASRHRDELKRALVEYAVRDVGYQSAHPARNAFIDTLENPSLAPPAIAAAPSDDIPW